MFNKANKYYLVIILLTILYCYLTLPSNTFFYKLKQIMSFLPLPTNIKRIINFYLTINSETYDNGSKYHKNSKKKRNVTPLQKKIVASNQKWKCAKCHQVLDFTYEIDHIIPLYKGGGNETSNLQALCRICHGRKTLLNQL